MKLSITALLLATSAAIAAPAPNKRDGAFVLNGLRARISLDGTMSFSLLDTNGPAGETPVDCNLIWPTNSAPDQNARCTGGEYLIQFPDGFTDIGKFTLALERVARTPVGGRAYLDETDGKWNCVENPEEMVKKDCEMLAALTRREDYYHDLYQTVYFVLHRNQECVVAFQVCHKANPRVDPEEWSAIVDRVTRVYGYLAHSTNEPHAHTDQPIHIHPRIVQYLCRLPDGYLLEKLEPGPLARTPLPPLASSRPPRETLRDPLLLLYCRWALQSLSVLVFLHEQSVYLMDFSFATIWIRDDLSIALNGFLSATIPTDAWQYSPNTARYEEEYYSATNPATSGSPELGPKLDLSDWATFIWRCMTDGFTPDAPLWSEPTDPLPADGDLAGYRQEQQTEGKFQLLDEGRLGPILLKAWKGLYGNAREILQDVRLYFEKIKVRMEGEDEILPDQGRWQDIFTVAKTEDARSWQSVTPGAALAGPGIQLVNYQRWGRGNQDAMDVDEDGQVRDGEGRADFNEHHVDVIDLTGDVDDNLKKLTEREQPESMDMDKIPQHPVKPEPSGTTAIKDEDSSRSPWASEIQLVRFRAMSEQVAESYLKKRNIRQSVDASFDAENGSHSAHPNYYADNLESICPTTLVEQLASASVASDPRQHG
ncbi:hypothetical protein ATERTT37_002267 [Aspergillus terreus]